MKNELTEFERKRYWALTDEASELRVENKLLRGLAIQAIGWTWAAARTQTSEGLDIDKGAIPGLFNSIQRDIPEMRIVFDLAE